MLTQKSAIEKATKFIEELTQTGIKLKKAILYGSYARSNQHEWSDIDLILVADEFTGFGFEDRKWFSKINIKKDYINIETRTYPSSYFKKGDPFIEEVKRTGIELTVSN